MDVDRLLDPPHAPGVRPCWATWRGEDAVALARGNSRWMVLTDSLQRPLLTERFQFDSRNGPPRGDLETPRLDDVLLYRGVGRVDGAVKDQGVDIEHRPPTPIDRGWRATMTP